MDDSSPVHAGPLAGVRIVDLTAVLFGAWTTQLLGDLGADVLKIEAPPGPDGHGGDILRWGAPSPVVDGMGPLFMAYNRNKRSVVLDLRGESDRRRLLELIAEADVFISHHRMSSLRRLGLSYEAVTAVRSDIVYVHCAGFGSAGPHADLPAYDDLIQAASGSADLATRVDGGPPRYLPGLFADKTSALFAAQATLAALFHRERTGEGQFVEVPMAEVFTAFTMSENLYGHTFDPPTADWGYSRVMNPNRRPFPTADGYLAVIPYSDRQWLEFFDLAGMGEEYRADARFADYRGRTEHADDLYALTARAARTRTTDDWLEVLAAADIPAMRVNRLDEVVDDPQLCTLFEWREHPDVGRYRAVLPPVRFSRTPAAIDRDPPRLGGNEARWDES